MRLKPIQRVLAAISVVAVAVAIAPRAPGLPLLTSATTPPGHNGTVPGRSPGGKAVPSQAPHAALSVTPASPVTVQPVVGSSPSVALFCFTSGGYPDRVITALRTAGMTPALVHGISWVFTWREIEPAPGKFDWSKIDAALAASDAAGYTSIIRVLAGEYSPPWAFTAFPSVHIPGGPWDFGPRPHALNTVVPWSPSFVAHWRSVIAAYGAHFDSRHDLFGVQMPGGGHQGEMSITGWPGWLDPSTPLIGGGTLGAGVYTDAKDIAMWDTFIDAYRAAFPNHPTALDIDNPMASASGGTVFQSVIAYAQQQYAGKVYYQQNGLRAQTPRTGSYFTTLHDLSASTKVGWQTGYGNNGTQSEADVMTSYQTAVASGASYFEALLTELTNPSFRTAVQYLSRYHR